MTLDGLWLVVVGVVLMAGIVFVVRKGQTSARREQAGIAGWGDVGLPADPAYWPPVLARAYRANNYQQVTALAAEDAPAMAAKGYVPVGQQYVEGSWSSAAWIIAIILIFFVLGILVLLYMILAKPQGTLTVTYQRQVPQPTSSPTRQHFPVGS